MQVWFIMALVFALLWIARQWRDRSSLPPRHPVPFAWSPGVSGAILVVVFSPVLVGGYAADRHLRTLVTRDALSTELYMMDQMAQRAAAVYSVEGDVRVHDGEVIVGQMLYSWTYYVLVSGAELSDSEMEFLEHYSPSGRIAAMNVCAANAQRQMHCGEGGSDEDLKCLQKAFKQCGAVETAYLITNNICVLAEARGQLRGDFSTAPQSETPKTVLTLYAIAVFLGVVAGCAGVLSFARVAAMCTIVLVVVVALNIFGPLYEVLGAGSLTRVVAAGGRVTSMLAGTLVVWLAVLCVRWRSRTALRDMNVVLLMVAPLIVPGLAVRNAWVILKEPGYVFGASAAGLLVGFLVMPLLSRYRALPWAT
jgi:hypothetical protein